MLSRIGAAFAAFSVSSSIVVAGALTAWPFSGHDPAAQATSAPKSQASASVPGLSRGAVLPAGAARIWEDRGELNPSKVYWGFASTTSDPLSRIPAPPFSRFEKDTAGTNPKAKLTDSRGIKWTAKFGEECHSDIVAPRLAWALGFGAVESYYVESGKINGVDSKTDLGKAKLVIKPDGAFAGGARFKRHNKDAAEVKDDKGADATWDEAANPGVPPEQLSGLIIFDVLVHDWDAQRRNFEVLHVDAKGGPENWFVVSDMGGSFSDRPFSRFDLEKYRKEKSFIKGISKGYLELNYIGEAKSEQQTHQRIPVAHAQWFRKQLLKLTDDEIQAAFDAAFATDGLNQAYLSGDMSKIQETRERELSAAVRAQIAGFVVAFRAKIEELKEKVPAEP